MYRQGDVLLIPVTEIPTDARPVPIEAGRVVLARGEATGHHHSVAAGPAVALLEAGEDRYLRLGTVRDLAHQEHAPITVPPGIYRVIRQREYDDTEEWRRVAD